MYVCPTGATLQDSEPLAAFRFFDLLNELSKAYLPWRRGEEQLIQPEHPRGRLSRFLHRYFDPILFFAESLELSDVFVG